MNKHVTAWLGAYHDGELRGLRLRQVKAHLAHCATCRAELESLRALATLLRESPAAETLTPPERFVAQVGLRLPRRPVQPTWKRALEIGWRLTPVGLLGVWAFVQAVFVVAGVVLVTLQMGLGGDLAAWLLRPELVEGLRPELVEGLRPELVEGLRPELVEGLPTLQQGLSLSELLSLSGASLGDVGQIMLRLLNAGGPLGWGVTLNRVLLVVIGLLYWSWLASWWARRQHRQL